MFLKDKTPFFFAAILYSCGFILFLEWLYPAVEIGETSQFSVFVMYAAFCFVISLLNPSWWLSFIFKGTGLLLSINHLFYSESFLDRVWLTPFKEEVSANISVIFSQNLFDLSNMFRSFLFLLLIWLMSYLIYYWFIEIKRIMLFIVMTIVYITVLDTFTEYDAIIPIIRIFILSFVALGMVTIYNQVIKESIDFKWFKTLPIWSLPIILVVLISASIGHQAPYYPPQWADPVPFIVSTITGNEYDNGSKIVQKVGYGEDDTRLGGSFVQDFTPVFKAYAKEKYYYRIETKDIYTGKGWERSKEHDEKELTKELNLINSFSTDVLTEKETVEIGFNPDEKINKLVYPYGINSVITPKEGLEFQGNDLSGVIKAIEEQKTVKLGQYQIIFDNPIFDISVLEDQETPESKEVDPEYLQLPNELPSRVVNLAKKITEGLDNQYERAKAIEGYFGEAGFTYQTSDIPVPKEKDDYVDQFLFDSKVGYCDNYSTSMVVMLRSIDIPARWVKGFTGGEKVVSTVEESRDLYEITNSNAHSWVEVYFEDVGWVPFEPTQGFTNPVEFEESYDELDLENEENEMNESVDETLPIYPDDIEQEGDNSKEKSLKNNQTKTTISLVYFGIGLLLILSIVLLSYLYRRRFEIKTWYLFKKYQGILDEHSYIRLYEYLLNILKHEGFGVQTNETLREYAIKIDDQFSTDKFTELTLVYEKILYNNQIDSLTDVELIYKFKILVYRVMNSSKNILR